MERKLSLRDFSERGLRIIASWLYGQSANVILSERLKEPATLAAAERSIFLDPNRCGLYDLFLLARLLQYRHQIESYEGKDEIYYEDEKSTFSEVLKGWIEIQKNLLYQEFPGISKKLDGYYQNSAQLPLVTWKSVEFSPLSAYAMDGLGSGQIKTLELTDFDVNGIDQDIINLIAAIEKGAFKVEHHVELPEMPVVRIPSKLTTRNSYPNCWEHLCERIKLKKILKDYIGCYLIKSLGVQDIKTSKRYRKSGIRFDFNRLHDVAVAFKRGEMPSIFQDKNYPLTTMFKPEQHLGILAVDINCIIKQSSLLDINLNSVFLIFLAKFFEIMKIDCIILGFRDRVVSLSNGRDVYFHLPFIIKDVNEEMNGMIYSKMETAWKSDYSEGEHASFQPLQLKTIKRYIQKAAEKKEYKFFLMHYYTFNDLGEKYSTPEIHLRTSQSVESIFHSLEHTFQGEWYHQGMLPKPIVNYATSRSILKNYKRK